MDQTTSHQAEDTISGRVIFQLLQHISTQLPEYHNSVSESRHQVIKSQCSVVSSCQLLLLRPQHVPRTVQVFPHS